MFLLKIYHIFGLIARTLRFFAAIPAAFAGDFLPSAQMEEADELLPAPDVPHIVRPEEAQGDDQDPVDRDAREDAAEGGDGVGAVGAVAGGVYPPGSRPPRRRGPSGRRRRPAGRRAGSNGACGGSTSRRRRGSARR